MRKGRPHPTASETPSVEHPAPRRSRSQASRLLRSSRRGEARFETPLNDDLTLSDFTNLLRHSSASICLVTFASPVPCDTNEWRFVDALYATPSKCVQANVSFARARARATETPEELLGQDLKSLFPESDGFREMFQAWHNHHLSRDGFEAQIADGSGKPTNAHVACYGHIVGNGLHRVWIITREIAKRSPQNRISVTSEHHLRSLLNLSGVLFIRTYPDGTVSFCSEETSQSLGIDHGSTQTADTILGPRCHPSDRPALESLTFQRHLRASTPITVTARLITANRGLRTYSLRQTPACIGEEVLYYDIIAVEPPVVVAKPAPFLASGFAHDANNHLLIASANVQHAERTLGAEHPALAPLKAALAAINQTSEIYAQARKLEYGITPQPTDVDVGLVFEEIIAQCRPLIPTSVKISSPVQPREIFVRVDTTHLRQILTNLVLNAREALTDGGTIILSATRKGKDPAQRCPIHGHEVVCVSVSDNGPGIELPMLETIFTPFVSTKTSATPRGLGLAMVKTLVERNNGEVSATSAQGIGTTFTICLPSGMETDTPSDSLSTISSRASRPLTVLVADDEASIREIIHGALTARGHMPTVCRNSDALLTTLKDGKDRFDALIVDDGMPGSSSVEIMRAIREISPTLPIIVVSGDPMAAHRIVESGTGATFLAKPFTFEKLYAELETVTRVSVSSGPLVAPRRRRTVAATE